MKKRFLLIAVTALLLTLCFAMPVAAGGGADVYVGSASLGDDDYVIVDEDGYIHGGNPSNYNIHYDATKGVLTLNDLTLESAENYGIEVEKDITIQLIGSNLIFTAGENISNHIYGIHVKGDVKFVGDFDAFLIVENDSLSSSAPALNIGIYAEGSMTVDASVLAYADNAVSTVGESLSCGIYCEGGDFTLNGGQVYCGGESAEYCFGLLAERISGVSGGAVVINEGYLDAMAYSGSEQSVAIYAGNYFTLFDGEVVTESKEEGIFSKNKVTFIDGVAKITAYEGKYAIRTESDKIVINGGILTVQGPIQAFCDQSSTGKPTFANTLYVKAGKDMQSLKYVKTYNYEPVVVITPFKDLTANWYIPSVIWALKNSVTFGVSDHEFAPNKPCTRAEIVCFLYRLEGSPEMSGKCPFKDVQKGIWYEQAVKWAVEDGITAGTDAAQTLFSPNRTCTRAEAACFIYRYCGSPEVGNISNPFVDIGNGGEYYSDAVMWMVENGITSGTDATHFSPNKTCTRAEIVAFLERMDESLSCN